MTGIVDLSVLLAQMRPALTEGEFVFCTFPDKDVRSHLHLAPVGMFVEEEGLTLVIERSVAEGNQIDCSAPFRRIVLTVHSSLEAVGLTAAVATALAECGISANMIAAFHHDHIFVPSDRAEAALAALHACQKEASDMQRGQ